MVCAGASPPVRLGWLVLGESHAVLSHEKSLAVFGRSRSYTGVRAQNPHLTSQPFAGHYLVSGPERYVARAELASIMGVSLATVDRMVAEGMPSVTWGRRTRRFRPSAAISWATERGRAA
jgi:hypothetical protein